MSEPFVSVITPVYNGVAFLRECMQSVVAQTHHNWQYTVVDNQSTDGSYELAVEIAALDSRIQVVRNTEFKARAAESCSEAMRYVADNSAYCKVVHADDWLYPECIEKMVAVAEQHETIGIVGSFYLVGQRVGGIGLPHDVNLFDGADIGRSHLEGAAYLFGCPSQLLLRSDLIKSGEDFYTAELAQFDVDACLRLLLESDFGFVHQVLSFQRVHDSSVSSVVSASIGSVTLEDLRAAHLYVPQFYQESARKDQMLQFHERDYYQKMGRNIPRLIDKDVRSYHSSELAKLGLNFSLVKVGLGALQEAFKRLSAPFRAQWMKATQKHWSG